MFPWRTGSDRRRSSPLLSLGALTIVLCFAGLALVAGVTRATTTPRYIVLSVHPGGAGPQQLFRVETTGAGLKQITTGSLSAIEPAFSPDGARLAFVRLGSGIFTTNVDGGLLHRLTANGRDSYPAWSPDGKRIAFTRLVGSQWRLFTMASTGRSVRRLPHAPPAGRPSWTADGKSIFIPAAGDFVKVDALSGRVSKYYGVTLDIQTGQTASISPNARSIAYVGPRISTGPPDCGEGRCPQFALYLANVAAPHRQRRLAIDTGAAGWSADGKTLAYIAKGVLTLHAVASATVTAIDTGSTADNIADGDAPPAWQPR